MMRALKQSQERTKYIYQNGYGKNSKAAWDTGAGKHVVPQWEKDMQDAEVVVAEAEAKQVSSDRLRLEASISAAEAAELGPALKEIDDKDGTKETSLQDYEHAEEGMGFSDQLVC